MKEFWNKHQMLYRVMRTFFQAAMGVVVSAVASVSGAVEDVRWQAVIVLAVSTGLAAVMNAPWLQGGEEEDNHE